MSELPGGWTPEAVLGGQADRVVMRARRPGEAPVVVKATPPGAGWRSRAALRREARLLEAAQGDGVVHLLDVLDRQGRTVLVLAFVAAGALADRTAPDPDPDLVVAHLTTAVERLHRLGLGHGALRPEHILLGADGRPVLCGFGAAHRSRDRDPDATALAALIRAV